MVEQTTSQAISRGIRISVIDMPKLKKKFTKKTNKDDTEKNNQKQEKLEGNTPASSYVTMFAAEFIGTGLLLFLGCMGCLDKFDDPKATHHMGSITFGLTVMMIIQLFGHISGAHLNPAVTIATVIFGMVKPMMAVVYIVAQFLGATIGYGLLKILIPDDYSQNGFCITTVYPKITAIQGLGIEIVITTVLILVCCAVWDKRNAMNADSVPLRFGLIIAAISMAAGPLTGASMNTARSFAPLVFGGSWENQWIYWIGPNVAAVIGCGIYKYLFSVPEISEDEEEKGENIHLDDVSSSNNVKV